MHWCDEGTLRRGGGQEGQQGQEAAVPRAGEAGELLCARGAGGAPVGREGVRTALCLLGVTRETFHPYGMQKQNPQHVQHAYA